tara:strand:- start:588 stop:839 length:252 start_codon:yes stop_codon:yes gene_type:complete
LKSNPLRVDTFAKLRYCSQTFFKQVKKMNPKNIITISIILLILGIVGNMDFQDELNEERIYRHNFCSGVHPDYKNLNPDCGGA